MTFAACPHCSYTRLYSLRRKKKKCKRCGREFSARRYPVEGFRVTDDGWRRCARTFLRERTAERVGQEVGVSPKTAQRMTHHVRLLMLGDRPPRFRGPVEMDETYVGGQRKNKRLHIRRLQPAKRGHGTEKLPIVGVFDRASGRAHVEVLERKLDIRRILDIVGERVAPGATVYTDGFKMYRMLPWRGFAHEWVDHADGELVRGDVHTNNIEGLWGLMKRRLGCIGGMRRDRLHLFVAEIEWKFNHRKLPLAEREERLLSLIIGGRSY